MPIEALNDNIARSKAFIKSVHQPRDNASYKAKAYAVAIPLKKSAEEVKTTFRNAWCVIVSFYSLNGSKIKKLFGVIYYKTK
jgi:hypothetical protein